MIFKHYIYLLSVGLISISLSCNKENDKNNDVLPALTLEGNNTFGVLINDEVYVPKHDLGIGVMTGPFLSANYFDSYFLISAKRIIDFRKQYIYLFADNVKSNGIVNFSCKMPSLSNPCQTMYHDFNDSWSYKYILFDTLESELNIVKLDTINKIISGTFWVNLVDTALNETVYLTDGVFDIKY